MLGSHIHFNRKTLGFNSKEYSSLLSNLNNNIRKAEEVDHKSKIKPLKMWLLLWNYIEKINQNRWTSRNKNILRWCQFETSK